MKVSNGYARIQIALHWVIVALIGVEYVFSDGMGRIMWRMSQGIEPTGITPVIHVWVGMAVLALVVVRIGARLLLGAPEAPAEMSAQLRRVSNWTHFGLYGLILAVPALGAVAWFWQIHWMGDLHSLLFDLLVVVAGLHVVGALYHHYIVGDDVMQRMLPASRRRT